MPGHAPIAVVIPCYNVAEHIMGVLARIGPEVGLVYCVDDACPQRSGDLVERENRDPRVRVLRNPENQGVGGAVITGYRQAVADGAGVIVKIDGDGQMDPALIGAFVAPVLAGEADYAKGNRFYDLRQISQMPGIRVFGNAVLSFMTKLSTGYWDLFDPTNGYTAIHGGLARTIPYEKVSRRYFFETDLLFRLSTFRAVVVDVPMDAHYGDERSGLKIGKVAGEFATKHVRNLCKRVFYNYFLRDFSVASLELLFGVALLAFGMGYGGYKWWLSLASGHPAPTGTIMLAAMTVLVGLQLVLAFLSYDIASVPRHPIGRRLQR
jgi:glycosyltransferase involved in cell wall biosynthesis